MDAETQETIDILRWKIYQLQDDLEVFHHVYNNKSLEPVKRDDEFMERMRLHIRGILSEFKQEQIDAPKLAERYTKLFNENAHLRFDNSELKKENKNLRSKLKLDNPK